MNMKVQSSKFKVQCSMFRTLNNEKGIALIVSLLLLLVATVVGVIALSTSTTNVMIAGNQRLGEINFAASDGGIEISPPIMKDPDATTYPVLANTITDPTRAARIRDEMFCKSQLNPDLQFPSTDPNFAPNFELAIGGSTVSVDIDFITTADPGPGYALEEGGTSVIKKHYRINSTSTGAVGSETTVGALYYIIGYCEL